MVIIIGLGNPGKQFERTRHNAGFLALDDFAMRHDFPPFTLTKKYEALISKKDNVMLVKPQTFMNESGRTAQKLMKNTKARLIVVHDEIDLPLGKFKISNGSGAGGHKGVESIIAVLGTKDFTRIRIGIETDPAQKAEHVVLEKFTPDEQKTINSTITKVTDTLESLAREGI